MSPTRSSFLLLSLITSTTAMAESSTETSIVPQERGLLAATPALPRMTSGNTVEVILEIKSLGNEDVPIAAHAGISGMMAFTTEGGQCYGVNINGLPYLSGVPLRMVDASPSNYTAGPHRPAFVEITFACRNVRRGDKINYTAAIYALSGRDWISQQFSWENEVIQ